MKTLLLTLISVISLNSSAQNVNIPDANFKAYLVGNALINTNGDSEIQISEAVAFNGYINCPQSNISDLTGIEAFTALTLLYCQVNDLTSLDVSQNTALIEFDCSNNQITSLDVTQNTNLNELEVDNNQLTSLNVTQNTALTWLICDNNQLTSLDVTQNTALTWFGCSYNQLTSLDVSNNIALTYFYCVANQLQCLNIKNGNNTSLNSFTAWNNPNLTCIEADDEWSNPTWATIDTQMSFSLDCANACSIVGVEELSNTPKELLKITDLIGREVTFKPNTPLIYIYSDGTAEKVFKMQD